MHCKRDMLDFFISLCSILRGNGFTISMPSDLHELNMLSELKFDEDMLSSKEQLATRYCFISKSDNEICIQILLA